MKNRDMFTLADRVEQRSFDLAKGLKRDVPDRGALEVIARKCIDLRMDIRAARRFKLSNAFLDRVIELSNSDVSMLVKLCDLANLPFDIVWFEFDMDYRMKRAAESGVNFDGEIELDRGRLGYLIKRKRHDSPGEWLSTTMIELPDEDGVSISAAATEFSAESSEFIQRTHESLNGQTDKEGMSLSQAVWGYVRDVKDGEPGTLAYNDLRRRTLNSHATFASDPYILGPLLAYDYRTGNKYARGMARHFNESVLESRGDIRFLVATLALINAQATRYLHKPSPGRYQHRLRMHDYFDYRLIELDTDKIKTRTVIDRYVNRAWKEDYARRRAHEVRGYWRAAEHGKAIACQHIPALRDGDYALCERCGILIRWVDFHMRGDPTLGYVHHDYEVVK